MKLEDQVCSLALAKQLKELGVKQESLWYWVSVLHLDDDFGGSETLVLLKKEIEEIEGSGGHRTYIYASAFTVAELGEMLQPYAYYSDNMTSDFPTYEKSKGGWAFLDDKPEWVIADTEANARARLLVYLLENKLA